MIKRYQYKYRESDTTLDLVYLEGNPPANTSLSYTCKCIQYVQVSFSIFFLKIQYPRPLRVVVIIMYMCLLIDFTSTYIQKQLYPKYIGLYFFTYLCQFLYINFEQLFSDIHVAPKTIIYGINQKFLSNEYYKPGLDKTRNISGNSNLKKKSGWACKIGSGG